MRYQSRSKIASRFAKLCSRIFFLLLLRNRRQNIFDRPLYEINLMKPQGILPKPLRGIVPPLITPLRSRDQLDVAGLEKLIEHILAGGVHGLFILGTTGEAPSLSYRLRRELIDAVTRFVRGRVPVLVGITDTAFAESVSLARHAAAAGARALVVSAPYYFPVGQLELEDYLKHLVAELPLPLFLYNIPMMTKVQFEPEIVRKMMDIDRVIGIKDSSGNVGYFKDLVELARERPDWSVLVGPENLLIDAIRCGGHGGVCGGANFYPQLYVELYDAAMRGDEGRLANLAETLSQVGEIYRIGSHASAVVKGIKCALSLMGICDDTLAEPFSKFHAAEREQVRMALEKAGLTQP